MGWPVRHLPVIQQWDCHGCGECCREYEVHVTEAERQRILGQGWENDPAWVETTAQLRKKLNDLVAKLGDDFPKE